MAEQQSAPAPKHIPVMLAEVMAALTKPAAKQAKGRRAAVEMAAQAGGEQTEAAILPLAEQKILDGTFGNGGYSRAFLAAGAQVLGLDRDPDAVKTGKKLAEAEPRFTMRQCTFSALDEAAEAAGFAPLDAVVLDIGVSSMQIDEAARGFSFRKDGPLDMRMAQSGMSAADAVNRLKPEDLARIFRFYGEERWAGRIARMIAARREEKPFTATLDLANAIEAMGLHRHEKIHAATRVFQALRIYVNNELGELAQAMAAAERALRPGGRLIVVSFHSLEDRLVKQFFAARAGGRPASRHLPDVELAAPSFIPLVKGAQAASSAEAAVNPRARSAKLRAGLRTDAASYREDAAIFGLPVLPPLFGE